MNNQISLFDLDSDYLESNLSEVNIKNAAFRVHASLIYKLGESLIADDVTALSELIKNSFDADATVCSLNIDSDYSELINGEEVHGIIEITDNGCGMDFSTIINGWLTLSNSPKKKIKKENKTTPKYNRCPLGDKGLGRLCVQKLGRYMQMNTKTEQSKVEYSVTIPWGDFLKNTTIDQIPVEIVENPVDNNRSYTTIIIKDLIDYEKWGKADQINILSNSISKIVSPFKSKINNFTVVATVNGQQLETVSKVFDELLATARAKHTIKYSSGKADILSRFKSSFFYNRNVLNKVMLGEFTLGETALNDFFTVNSDKLTNVNRISKDGFSIEMTDFYESPIVSGNKAEANDPGEFECEIYEYYLDKKYLDHLYEDISFDHIIERDEYRGLIERFHGIKVVRDGFVIQGFGEGDGGDWLGLSSSSKTTGSYIDLRNETVIGCVYISGLNNAVLKETTNREGFVDDNHSRAFKSILEGTIKRINRNRKKLNDLMTHYVSDALNQTASSDNEVLRYKSTIEEIKENIRNSKDSQTIHKEIDEVINTYSSVKKMISETPNVTQETINQLEVITTGIFSLASDYHELLKQRENLSRQIESISLDFERMQERIQDLFELAGLGLSVEMFSHEFDASIRSVRQKNRQVLEEEGQQTVDSLIKHINYVNYSLEALRKQMSYFNPGLKYVRAERQIFTIAEFITTHRSFYNGRCESKKIDFQYNITSDFTIRINRGMLNQVFDNLYNNAEYWLNYSVDHGFIEKKEYHVETTEKGVVVVWDNGIGVSKDIENRLFEPFETKKEDGGRGLGLYIAAMNLGYNSSKIRLLNERNVFGNLYKFEIDLTAVVQ